MHEFYERIARVFKDAGSSRYQFCKKYKHHYQTLQAYWNSDKLPSGKVLEDLAREYHVSLDALVLGHEENPIINRIVRLLKQQDEQSLLRIDGAIQMFLVLARAPTTKEAEIVPERIEKALKVLEEMAKLIRKSDLNDEGKKAVEDMLNKVIVIMYERETKEDWAELEEVD